MKLKLGLKPLYTLLGVLMLLTLLGLGISRSPAGLELLCKYLPTLVPGLALDYSSGNLSHARFRQISWQDEHTRVDLEDVEWQLNLICLIDSRLCIKQLDIDKLVIEVSGSGENKPLDLSPVILPLEIALQQGKVGTLRIINQANPAVVLDDLELAALWRLSTLTVHRLNGRQDTIHAQLTGWIELREQLAMEISGDIAYTDAAQQQFAGRIRLAGDLNQLIADAWLSQPESLTVTGHLYPLQSPVVMDAIVTRDTPLNIPGSELILNRARLQVSGSIADVKGQLTASISDPVLGANDLVLAASWNGSELQIGSLNLRNSTASLSGSGQISFSPVLTWQLDTFLSMTCQPEWQPYTDCSLEGPVRSKGSLDGDDYVLDFSGHLSGEFNGESASVTADTRALPGNRWTLHSLALTLGASTLRMQGYIDNSLAITGELELTDLTQLDPSLQGTGRGKWQLKGSLEEPELNADFNFQSVQSGDFLVKGVDISGNWSGRPGRGSIELAAQDGHWGTLELKSLATLCNVDLRDNLSGQVACTRLDLMTDSILGNWQLSNDLELVWQDPAAGFSLAPFCMNSNGTSVCSKGTPLFTGKEFQDVQLVATNIAVDWLRNFLPPEIELKGTFGLTLDAENMGPDEPRIEITTSGQQLTLGMYSGEQLVQQSVTKLNGRLLWEGQQVALSWDFALGEQGTSIGSLDITDWQIDKKLNGTFKMSNLQIAPFILPNKGVLAANGLLNGTVRLQGIVSNPLLTGKLQIVDGHLEHERLPTPLEKFNFDVTFDGPDVLMQGAFTVAAGSGSMSGKAHLGEDSWLAELDLQADNLIVEPLRGSEVTLQPDIQISLTREKASIRGNVTIPKAEIIMDRLPKTAKNISPDTIIVGEEKETGAFDYELDINLRLGENVKLRAIGANAELTGNIQLSRNPGQPLVSLGEIEIVSGRYVAYGQRLEVKEGKLFFNGSPQRPQIRLLALRPLEAQDVEVGVRVGGDAKYPEIEIYSQPSMDENMAMYYLLTGHAPETGTNLELAVATAMLQLGISGASRNTTEIMEKLGVQNFQVDARKQEGGTEFNVSGYLSPKLYLGYGVSTFEKVNTVRARYRLQQKLYLEALSGADSAIDFLYSITR